MTIFFTLITLVYIAATLYGATVAYGYFNQWRRGRVYQLGAVVSVVSTVCTLCQAIYLGWRAYAG